MDSTYCILCSDELSEFEIYHYGSLCDSCAEHVANMWNYSHSGAYLTYENQSLNKNTNRPGISEKTRWEIFKADNYQCVSCGSKDRLTIDHISPISKGGANEKINMRTLCRSCNSRKGDRL